MARADAKRRLGKWLVAGRRSLYLVVFFAVPTLIMVLASFRTPGEFGGLAPLVDEAGRLDLNVESYARFFTESRLRRGVREVDRLRARRRRSCASCSPIRSRR